MRVGIICEGHADRAVISNIVLGATDLDSTNLIPILPEEHGMDETDKFNMKPGKYGGWPLVKNACSEQDLIENFLSIEGQDFVIIHIDSSEAEQYNVRKPEKNEDYCLILRELIIEQINLWLGGKFKDDIIYAIAIEEIDSWILALHLYKENSLIVNPKKRLERILGKKNINSISNYKNYKILSNSFLKKREIELVSGFNCSLKLFYEEVVDKLGPDPIIEVSLENLES